MVVQGNDKLPKRDGVRRALAGNEKFSEFTVLLGGMERSDLNRRPGYGGNRVPEFEWWTSKSGSLRCLCFGHALRLRALLPLDNFELNIIAFLEALVTLGLDGTVVDEHIGTIIAADETKALCVIKPFHFTFNSRHVPYSRAVLKTRSCCGPMDRFFLLLGFANRLRKDALHQSSWFVKFLVFPARTSVTRYLGFEVILPSSRRDVNSSKWLICHGITGVTAFRTCEKRYSIPNWADIEIKSFLSDGTTFAPAKGLRRWFWRR